MIGTVVGWFIRQTVYFEKQVFNRVIWKLGQANTGPAGALPNELANSGKIGAAKIFCGRYSYRLLAEVR
jgi:hypothetical protein